jgi:UDP-4-amino-4,6-dideoxy-N-acetyl-beta-L-altrosamine transaminase
VSGNSAGFLPYARQTIEEDDIAAVCAALRSDYLTTGPTVNRFEENLAQITGARHAVVCANGTAALYMAARALKLGQGTKVIVPAVTFLATASAPHLCGADIVFADVDPDCGLMRPKDLKDALKRAGTADALFNVHLGGQCGELEEIADIARDHGLKIVDDACHAIGTDYIDKTGTARRIGSNAYCDLSVFSFHAVKTITLGEGGAVTANDAALDHALRLARSHGMTRDPDAFVHPADALAADGGANPWYYELIAPEFNFRATDIQCALGISQLTKLERFVERRRTLSKLYDRMLAPLAPKIRPVLRCTDCHPAWHLYVALIDFEACGSNRAETMHRLAQLGIGSQVHYFPVHRQPYYKQRYGALSLPGAERYYAQALSLPLFASMRDEDVERVCVALKKILFA